MTTDQHLNFWVIVMPDGTIDGGFVRINRDGTEITREQALKALCPRKVDLLKWAASGAQLRPGTRQEAFS